MANEFTLSTVANDWSTTALQAHTSPLKIVHDAACANAPTLQLGLSTSVPGTLTVDGTLAVAGVTVAPGSAYTLGAGCPIVSAFFPAVRYTTTSCSTGKYCGDGSTSGQNNVHCNSKATCFAEAMTGFALNIIDATTHAAGMANGLYRKCSASTAPSITSPGSFRDFGIYMKPT